MIIVQSDTGKRVRFRIEADQKLYQIHSVTRGDPSKSQPYTLMDPAFASTSFDFAQPVIGDRLIPVEGVPLTQSHEDKTRIRSGGREGEITASCVDGIVHICWGDSNDTDVVDLSRILHEFLS